MNTVLNKDLMINTISDGFWVNDFTGNFIEVNDALCKILEYSREELLKMNINDIEVAECASKLELHQKKIVEQGSDTYVTKHRTKNGRIVDVSINANFNKQVSPHCIYVFSQNISEKLKNTDESQKIMHALLDAIDDVIYVADPKTHELLFVNEKFKEYWGDIDYTAKCYNVLQGRSEPCPFCTNHLIFGEYLGKSYVWEFQNEITKNWYRCSDRAIDWVDGRKVRFEIAADISHLKNTELALKHAKDYSENLISTANAIIVVLDDQGNIKTFNKAAEEITGYSIDDLSNRNWFEVLTPKEKYPNVWEEFERLSTGGIPRIFENPILTKSGVERIIAWQNNAIINNSKIEGIISFGLDITERLIVEQKLKSTLTELERSNKELEQFAYVASHDLQEPLRMVSSYTQLLERRYKDKLDDDALDFINFAVDGANRMQRLINDLLEYSRVTTRGKAFEKVDLSGVLGMAIANLHNRILETGALITNDDLPFCKGDEMQLVRVFQNLLENALKFKSETAPRIHVSTESEGDMLVVSVKDNGIGIERQYQDRIFTIFQRLNTKKDYPGTGIGLAICKRTVERHGGKIWFESEPGNGTTFKFSLKK